jgi:hypothetical protein
MKRRNQKTTPAQSASRNEAGRKSCVPPSCKGAARQDKMLVAGLLIVIAASAVMIGSVLHSWKKQWIGKNMSRESGVESLQAQMSALKSRVKELEIKAENPATQESESLSTGNERSSAFENAVDKKDFGKIESLMADEVYYIVDASDCCGDISKKEAVDHLRNYIKSAKTFNFDQSQQVIRQMKVNLAETFSKYTIGIADNRMVLSYTLNKQGKVNNIFLSVSHLMYDLE